MEPEAEFKEFELQLVWDAVQTLVPLEKVLNVSLFEPSFNWNRFLADQRLGLNYLNSASELGTFVLDSSDPWLGNDYHAE